MFETPYPARRFDPDRPTGASLTIGSVAKLADAVVEARTAFARFEAKTNADLADLGKRIDAVIATTKATIAEADRRDALRRGPRQ
jgi:hypothetical protein